MARCHAGVRLVGGDGEEQRAPSITHLTSGDVVKGGGGAGPAGGGVVASYEPAVKLSLSHPRASPGCHEFSCLVTLVRKMANKGASPPPPSCSSFDSFFFLLLLARLSRKAISAADKFRVVFLFFLQLSANKGATCYTEAAPSQGNASKTSMFFFFCKFLHAHSQCLRCRVKKPKAAICGVIVPSDWKAALASESDGVLSVR